jgi:ribonuclease P protein subunit RPR2
MPNNYSKKPASVQKIALNRILFLFREAKKSFKEDSALADKYVKLAIRISMKYKVKIPLQEKKSFCKKCHKLMVQGVNCRTRIHKHRIIYYCKSCKNYTRMPLH